MVRVITSRELRSDLDALRHLGAVQVGSLLQDIVKVTYLGRRTLVALKAADGKWVTRYTNVDGIDWTEE